MQGVQSTRSDGALLLVLVYSVLEWALIVAVSSVWPVFFWLKS